MTFGAPHGWWLFSLPVVWVLLHVFRQAKRRRVVSSIRPWQELAENPTASSRWAKPHLDAGMLIGACILIGLAVAGMDPWLGGAPPEPVLGVVVDASESMAAPTSPGGSSRLERARDLAASVLDGSPTSRVRVLAVDGSGAPGVSTALPGDTRTITAALSRIDPSGTGAHVGAFGLAMADMAHARGGGRVLLVGDCVEPRPSVSIGGQEHPDVSVETVCSGEDLVAIGITSAVVSPRIDSRGQIEVLVFLSSSPVTASPIDIEARHEDEVLARGRITPDETGRGRWELDVDYVPGRKIEIRLGTRDAWKADDALIFELPPAHGLRFEDAALLPRETEVVLDLLNRSRPPGDVTADAIEVVPHLGTGDLPDRWISIATSVEDRAGPASSPVVLEVFDERVAFLDRFYPILVDPALVPANGPPAGATPVAHIGGEPVVALVEHGSTRGVWWGLPPGSTNLTERGAWPLVLEGFADWIHDWSSVVPGLDGAGESAARDEGRRSVRTAMSSTPRRLRMSILIGVLAMLVIEIGRRMRLEGSRTWALLLLLVVAVLVAIAWTDPVSTSEAPGTLVVVVDAVGIDSAERDEVVSSLLADTRSARNPPAIAVYHRSASSGLRELIERGTARAEVAGGGSLVLVAGGGAPTRSTLSAVRDARRRGVPVHVLPVEIPTRPDAAVDAVLVPAVAKRGQRIESLVIVRSTVEQRVRLDLEQDGRPLASVEARLEQGSTHAIPLSTVVDRPGRIVARVSGELDEDPTNDTAIAHLVLAGTARFASVGLDRVEGLDLERFRRPPPAAVLGEYDAVLVGVGPRFVPSWSEQELLADYVREGHGLVLASSDAARAALLRGGPLEGVLPVELAAPELDDRAAVVLLLDRSGSMDSAGRDETSGGIGVRIVEAVASVLRPGDEVGVVGFDVEPHIVRPLGPASEPTPLRFAGQAPRGGTDWGPALDLALSWLQEHPAAIRHVILVTDGLLAPGADGLPVASWPDGVSMSTVAVGTRVDRAHLATLAARHGGRFDEVSEVSDLPGRLRRAAAASRLPGVRRGGLELSTTAHHRDLVSGTVLATKAIVVTPRPSASVAMVDEFGDAVLTFGIAGWGRTGMLAVSPDAMQPPDAGSAVLATSLGATSGVGTTAAAPASIVVRDGVAQIDIADVEGDPAIAVRAPGGGDVEVEVRRVSPRRAHSTFPVHQAGEYLVVIDERRYRLFVTGSVTERPVAPIGWAERLAGAGGGRVRGSGSLGVEVESREVSRRWAFLLIGLAAGGMLGSALLPSRRFKPHK